MKHSLPFHTGLITGASSGIGRAMACELAHRGIQKLILVSRNQEKLDELKSFITKINNIDVRCISLDLSEASSPEILLHTVQSWGWEVDCLVNNAGFAIRTEDEFNHPEKVQQMIQLMATSPLLLSQMFGKLMAEKNHGYILNVSSIVGGFPVSSTLTYAAIKRFMNAFSHALSYEWRPCKVFVTCLQPGATTSSFHQKNNFPVPKKWQKFFRPSEQIAKEGINGLIRKKRNVIPGWEYKILFFITHLIPHSWLFDFHKSCWRDRRDKICKKNS